MSINPIFMSAFASLVVGISGCGGGVSDMPKLASASGTLMMKGQPLANAEVRFIPMSAGGPSNATTDENGNFEMRYSATEMGAVVGRHAVDVTVYGKRGPVEVEGELGPPLEPPKEFKLGQFTVEPEGSFLALEIDGA